MAGPPTILELDFSAGLRVGPSPDPITAMLARRRPRLADLVTALDRARADDRVVGLVAKVGGPAIGMGVVQELRNAVGRMRAAGKYTVAWAETFGEFGPGTVPYYLASAFEHIIMQPSGDLCCTGVSVESRFFRDALDACGVVPEAGARHEYKSAANMFLERGYTEPHHDADRRLAASLSEEVEAAVARSRRLSIEQVRAAIDRAPLLGREAVDAGLVDRLAYRDEVYRALRERFGEGARFLYAARYRGPRSISLPSRPSRDRVALVDVSGTIARGISRRGVRGAMVGSDTTTAALRAAIADDAVKAIVLRVNSPGGSYVASDAIWREVWRAREHGKPVVASMVDVAASGGYYVAMGADRIVAQPGTLTGSIGVFGGKPVVAGLLDRIGVAVDGVGEGRRSRMFSTARRYSEDEWERVNAWLDRVYADFVGKAAAGRGMGVEQLDERARGRVWTGADAHDNGLVDELGGLDTALQIAREIAGIDDRASLKRYPIGGVVRRLRPARSSEDRAATVWSRAAGMDLDEGPLAVLGGVIGSAEFGPLLLPVHYSVR